MITEKQRKFVKNRLVVTPGSKVVLERDFDPGFKIEEIDKERAEEMLADGVKLLAEMQDKLYAQDTYAVLVIFQAMDAAGKDGTIKHVMSGLNPQGCQVYSFKAPSAEELDHDYLWRCAKALPERGRIGIFNRSYYEEVLVARVHPEILARQQLPAPSKGKGIWRRRYREMRNFEQYLVDNGIIVIKFFLHISREEQRERFLKRINTPEKNWKMSVADVIERQHWNDYMKAYEECLSNTSTEWAPWYVIPADHKPTARLLTALVLYERLDRLDLAYPRVTEAHREELLRARKLLESEV